MVYADYEYYSGTYEGKAASAEDFPRLAAFASRFIDKITLGIAAKHADDDRLKMCCCELVDTLCETAKTGGFVKQSESVGAWSYTLNSAAANKTAEDIMLTKCRNLLPSEWLYRGVARE